ncbi:capsular biosynthesis protein [Cupriavidus necator]
MIRIVFDENISTSAEVASYLANCIRSGRKCVSIVSLDRARKDSAAGIPQASSGATISLTPKYRPMGAEKIVYWLDEANVDTGSGVGIGTLAHVKHVFMNAMGNASLRRHRVFVDGPHLKSRLVATAGDAEVLRFPLTYNAAALPGKYSRTVAVDIDSSADMTDDALRAALCAVCQPGIQALVVHCAEPAVLAKVARLEVDAEIPVHAIHEFDAFVAALSGSLLYVGIGLSTRVSFQRLALAATLLRPVVFYRSSVDDAYFVNEVTGFETDELATLGHAVGMFARDELNPQQFGECLYLHYTRRYCPDNILLEALQ